MSELAKRAVAIPDWRWVPGMRDANGDTVVMVKFGLPYVFCWDEDGQAACASTEALPDLDDPCTLGGLLSLVREACEPNRAPGDWPMVCTYQSQAKKWGVGAWLIESGKATFAALVLPTYHTEAEALVAALEAAGAAGGEE